MYVVITHLLFAHYRFLRAPFNETLGKPKNIIVVVADSLRYDSVYREEGPGVPYLEGNAVQFSNARSSGCWTLPATSSMFTGLLPHEHGATSQSRWLKNDVPSISELLKGAGYKAIQVSANVVTTDIFNVSRGFDEVYKTWNIVKPEYRLILRAILALNRPRIRRMLLKPKDHTFDKISEDLRQGIVWSQKTSDAALAKAKQLIEENNAKGKGVFMFVNLMETHYPYHIANTFKHLSTGLFGKIHEWKILYHFLSQSFLKTDKQILKQSDLDILRRKQQLSWKLIRDDVDSFCKQMHQGQDNLVVFCSDHGDNFGDQGWQYHFSNVTDGGNKVPYFWLDHESPKAETKTFNVASRFMFYDILRAAGVEQTGKTMMEEREDNLPMLEGFWYNNEGRTLAKYKYNQLAFIEGDKRFVKRAGDWMYAPTTMNGNEPVFEFVEKNFNPLEELNLTEQRKKYLKQSMDGFSIFSENIMNKGK
ncbi:MAG: sulfatase-like hydrolase/transferase [Bacteroidetes bacterium]|nr:sulfatase-like hydrolase/transferase [Bacteroidota bacterium]